MPVRGTIREGLAGRELRLFLVSSTASSLALWGFTVVLALAAYRAAGAGGVTLAVVARVLPAALAAPFTALLADRRSRRGLLLALAAGSTALLTAIALVVVAAGPFAVVLALTAGYSVLTSGLDPAQAALLPSLARTPRELAAANSLWNGLNYGALFLGSLIAGVAVSAWSLQGGFALMAAASMLATLALLRMTPDARPPHRAPRPGATVARELSLGVREVRRSPGLGDAVSVLVVLAFVNGVLDVLIVVVAVKLVGLGTGGVGTIYAAWGAGGLAGAFAGLALLSRGRFGAALAEGAVLLVAPLCAAVLIAAPAVAVAAFAIFGVGYAVTETTAQTLVQRLASDETLARAFGVAETASQASVALGAVAAPLLMALVGVRLAVVITALTLPLLLVARRQAFASLDAHAAVPERELALLRALDLFAPLPLATIETLAVRAVAVPVAAGDRVIRQHEMGSRFYVVADGEFDVDESGRWLRRQGPGDYFGEIALLHDVPRTAGVTAVGDGALLALDRDDFLGAVTGHARSTEAAEHVVGTRLGTQPAG
ncbi:MAG TPA: cyclic nucleotide-binding domain-containing protein [Solirubrobacteraceae bacterium]|nr:cyclic nucleotide-binding domain-containing protein [Solirubrobacteraceae bacterium]